MLIHKQTLGVLEYAPWDGTFRTFNGERFPLLWPATVKGLGLAPAEWWEVDGRSTLAAAVRRSWPWFDPVVGTDGGLLEVKPWPDWRVYGEEPPPPAPEEAPPRRRKRWRKGLKLG